MINPKNELFRWGPIPGKPIYVSYFMEAIAELLPRGYKYRWPEIFFYFIGDNMTFICEYQPLKECGKKHFISWIMDDQEFKKVKAKYADAVEKLHKVHNKVKNLKSLDDKALLRLYQEWQAAYLNFWGHGLVPELANWGGEQLLKEKLEGLHLDEASFLKAMERLSAPEYISFYQEEELELLKLKLKENAKDFEKLLNKHAEKYFWIQNSYFETFVLEESSFKKALKDLDNKGIAEEIQRINNFPRNAVEEKKKICKELHLSEDIQKIAYLLSYCIYWQDARKKQIFMSNHYIKAFIDEIARRKKIKVEDLENCWCSELESLLKGRNLKEKEVQQRRKQFLGHYTNKISLISEQKEFNHLVFPFLERKIATNVKEIKGIVASIGSGIVKGRVKILMSPKEWKKVSKGDILVVPMTSPEYITAMRKAAAIVTDEGGMTSHASIVSRELGVPCIVGTKIATKVLKDRMIVEVNAKKGVVRVLK